jgi:hypothetical protein
MFLYCYYYCCIGASFSINVINLRLQIKTIVLSQCCCHYKIVGCYAIRRCATKSFAIVGFLNTFVVVVIIPKVGKCMFMNKTFETWLSKLM